MTGHRATVSVDGVRWEIHADGSRTATVGPALFRAEPAGGEAWHVYREDPQTGGWQFIAAGRLEDVSDMARAGAA